MPTNYHTLADFRVKHAEFLEQMMVDGVAALMAEGLVNLDRIAQDGVRVRASAGAASFRRVPTLEECLEQAKEQVETLRKELESDPAASSKRVQAARERAAQDRQERVEAALEQAKKIRESKPEKEKEKARASTTDHEARVMKMGDGGFRPVTARSCLSRPIRWASWTCRKCFGTPNCASTANSRPAGGRTARTIRLQTKTRRWRR